MTNLEGGLAQLARASALHAEGQRFESVILHPRPLREAMENIIKKGNQPIGAGASRFYIGRVNGSNPLFSTPGHCAKQWKHNGKGNQPIGAGASRFYIGRVNGSNPLFSTPGHCARSSIPILHREGQRFESVILHQADVH